jgi:hypothetical protein
VGGGNSQPPGGLHDLVKPFGHEVGEAQRLEFERPQLAVASAQRIHRLHRPNGNGSDQHQKQETPAERHKTASEGSPLSA